MTPEEIIQALTPYTGKFPEAAFRAAIEQKDDPCPCGSGKKHKKCCLLKA
jgi:uncharacterized protein YecA (UPF0149 family)